MSILIRYISNISVQVPVLVLLLLFSSCRLTRYVPEGDKLFTGSEFVSDSIKLNKNFRKELDKLARPKLNASFLGIRYRLMLYNAIKPPKKQKGLFYKMKYKWGEAPVLLSQARPKLTEQRSGDYLFSIGYLRPEVTGQVIEKDSLHASMRYKVNTGVRYTIRNIIYPEDSTGINGWLKRSKPKSKLRSGQFMVLNDLSQERERIDDFLKNNGFYFFTPDMLLFRVDSLHNGEADLYLTVKNTAPKQALKPWWLGEITIYGNYRQQRDSAIQTQEGKKGRYYTVVDAQQRFRTSVFEDAIIIKENQIYRKNLHTLTIERLMNLQTFSFVRTAYFPVDDSIKPRLNTRLYLTPARKQSLRFEIAGNTKSNNFIGSELTINYKNVNLLKGAEILEARISGGFDVQVGGKDQLSSTAYTVTGEVKYSVPRFLPRIGFKTGRNSYLPRTVFNPLINYIRRPELYTLRSIGFSAGYNWKQGKMVEHTLRLINLNSIYPTDITPKFDSMLQEDVTLKAAFEKQLIIGSRYLFQYNNTFLANRKFTYASDINFSTSGNLANLFIRANPDTPQAKKIANIPVSQFLRLQVDLRGYWKLSSLFLWANRVIGGYAWAYGNSITVPYSEQFFIGGSSSIRAFRTRTLGPGSFHTDETEYQANESGEIKFEMNSELRYNMSRYLKLAFFVDAGNIWLRKDAPDKPGSGLYRGDFFNEFAVGSGIGFRIDASVLVLRFDFAMPLRKPWYPEGNRWVFNEINFGSKEWRKENLLLNIGIGYPF